MTQNFVKLEGKDYLQNFYRFKLYNKFSKTYLLTTDDGNYIFVNFSAFKQLKKGKIENQEIYSNLISSGIIITPQNINKIIKKTIKRYSFLSNGTSLHIVVPTDRCNQLCTYCFASAKNIDDTETSSDLDEPTAKKIIEFIMNSPSKAITIEFQGGEPTLRFDMIKIMATYAKKLNKTIKKDLQLTIVSNLTKVNEEIITWLINNDITICTSLDGPEHIHNKNRIINAKEGKRIGTHKTVTTWINKINKIYSEKNIDLRVNSLPTITKYSLPYYKEIIDEHLKYNLNTIDIRALTRIGRINEFPELTYTNNEFEQFYLNSLNYLKELEKEGKYVTERIKKLYETKILKNVPGYHTDCESPCGATTGQIVYHSDGKIYTCHEGLGREEFQVGDVTKDTWQDIFKRPVTQKAILNSMLEQNVKCDRCVYKPYCGTCMIENFYHLNKFNFYPTKTQIHHSTILQSNSIFNKIYNKLKIEKNL